MMKIACISTSRIPSDTANSIQVMKTCQALARLGHLVHLLVPGKSHTAWEELAERYGLDTQFHISWLPANPRLKHNDFAWIAIRSARELGAELVYTWTMQSAVFALLRQMPVVFEAHDLPTGKLGPLWFRAFWKMPGKKRLLPITQALLDRLEKTFGPFPNNQVVIAPNGVDLEQYQQRDAAAMRRELALPEQITVLCAGHLYAGRGTSLFLALAERFSQASFVWVGGRPSEVETYREKAAAAGLRNVTFTGFVSQRALPCYQAVADILLMPYARSIAGSSGGNSAEICSPMKMFDYLAAGRAILSSDLPVIREVLTESSALFAPPEDLEGWSAAIDRLLRDEALRDRLAGQARRDAARYTWLARAQRSLDGFASPPA